MTTYRKTSIIVGILFIIGTVAGVLSGLVSGPVLDDPDYLALVHGNESTIVLGAVLVLVMGFPLAMVPVVMYPLFKDYSRVLALGAIIFRGVLEAVTYIIIALSTLLLIPLSREFVVSGAAEASYFYTLGMLTRQTGYWTEHILALVFSLGSLMLSWLFYKTRLIPRWLALWGFLGSILYIAAPVLNMFDPAHQALSLGVKWGNLMAPLAIQEMVFGLWVIVKGFEKTVDHS